MIDLTLIQSEEEILSGIPKYIEFETSDDADIFYTLDGTIPTEDSLDGTNQRIYLPTSYGTVHVMAVAISESSTSSVLEYSFATDSSNLNTARRIGDEGVIVMLSVSESEESISVNSDGYAAQELREASVNYDLKASETNSSGIQISGGKTSFSFVNKVQKLLVPDAFSISSVNGNVYFDPRAKVVYVNGSSRESLENQVVKLVNRTYNTFEPSSPYYEERRHRSDPLITGNYVRSFYNPVNKKYVSYYWESLESRWIISEQTVEPVRSGSYPSSKNRFVFRWIENRGLSSTLV
jgi:hypothetical protein